MLKTHDVGIVSMTPNKPIFIEQYNYCQPFGRFVIVDNYDIVAVGIVKEAKFRDIPRKYH